MKNEVNTALTKNYSISILRVVGMFSIVFCHFFSWFGLPILSQFFNFGVYLFLFISGFLYANKNIADPQKWFLARLKKILVPYYIFAIPIALVYFLWTGFDPIKGIMYSLCLQGINFICPFISFTEIEPLGNLWFITIILLCYLLTIILKNFEKEHNVSVAGATVVLLLIWLVPKILMCFSFPYIDTQYFVAYFIGYYISKFNVKNNKWTFFLLGLFMFAAAIVIRLIAKKYLDGIYESEYLVFVSLTQIAVAVSSYFICTYLVNNFSILESMAKSKIWSLFDVMSYPIYITHYAFLTGMTSVSNFGFSTPISILLFVLFTVISSSILYLMNNKIQILFVKI